MNKCLNCGETVKNKYCNVSCQNKHQNIFKSIKKYGEYINFDVCCERCNKNFKVLEREKLHPVKEKYFCSKSCANKRNITEEIKNKISNSLSISNEKHDTKITIECENCRKSFIIQYNRREQKTCSRYCNMVLRNKNENLASKGGLASVQSQSTLKRSKNEIYFSELCESKFNHVLTNAPIFNGWDADIILEEYKIAILWNGKWHYEKITEKHSLEQVQNRDKIKINEIIKSGYKPYIIKDMGKENKDFVISEFTKFINSDSFK